MRTAIIDIGTNTFHLLISEMASGSVTTLHKEKVAVRLGKDGISKGIIAEEAVDRAIATLLNFRSTLERHEPDKVIVTATSAVRNANNRDDVTNRIFKTTGFRINVLNGEEEALLIYHGVRKFFQIGEQPVLIMDIGGGSIEFIIGTEKEALWMKSFELGGQRLMDKFHKNDPITSSEVRELTAYLSPMLDEVSEEAKKHGVRELIGSSGTFDTLLDIKLKSHLNEHHNAQNLDLGAFQIILNNLVSKTRKERLEIPGMIPMRVDMIVVASILTDLVVKKIGIDNIRVSAYALKEGLLFNPPEQTIEQSANC